MNESYYCVILAGGIGSRLWPSSRQNKPKQFIDMLGTGETLIQTTYKRFGSFIPKDNILIISNENYSQLLHEQLPDVSDSNIILEPQRRGTVQAVTLAALEISRRDPNATMVVCPSDQNITDIKGQASFAEQIIKGLDYAYRHSRLLTIGVTPTRPEVAYGYIQFSAQKENDIYHVKSFTEKPHEDFARMFMESGEFLWNTGIFIWGASTFLKAIKGTAIPFVAELDFALRRRYKGEDTQDEIDEIYSKIPNLALEQSVLEISNNVDVMHCHFGWADLGTWTTIHEHSTKDSSGNAIINSKALLYDCHECIVRLPEGHVAVIQGLTDYIIVEEGNVVVVCRKDDQGAIRKFVNDAQMNLGENFV